MTSADPVCITLDIAVAGSDISTAIIEARDRATGRLLFSAPALSNPARAALLASLREILAGPEFRPAPARARSARQRRLVTAAKVRHGRLLDRVQRAARTYCGQEVTP